MTDTAVSAPLTAVAIPEELLDWATQYAAAIDAGEIQARRTFPQLAAAGLVDLGAPFNTEDGLIQQAAVLERLAQDSFSVAFALWGHRMVVEFLELAGGDYAQSALPGLRAGTTPGASAMASGYKSLAGVRNLDLHLSRDNEGRLRLSGRIGWASNLYTDAIAVAPAYGPAALNQQGSQGGVVIAFPLSAEGVHIGPDLDILAMRGTASTHVALDNVELEDDQILTADFTSFVGRTRPTLSMLQASLCLGLATASYRVAAENATGVHAVFHPEIQDCGDRLISTKHQLVELASLVGTEYPPNPRDVLAMRLQAGQLATQLATLETKTTGGKAFITTSDTNRRYREATFIPLQAPSESQLRWELAQA